MVRSKLIKAVMLGLCLSAFSTSVAFAQMSTTSVDTGVTEVATATEATADPSATDATTTSQADHGDRKPLISTAEDKSLDSEAALGSSAEDNALDTKAPLLSTAEDKALDAEAPLVSTSDANVAADATVDSTAVDSEVVTKEEGNDVSAPMMVLAIAGGAAVIGCAIIVSDKKRSKK